VVSCCIQMLGKLVLPSFLFFKLLVRELVGGAGGVAHHQLLYKGCGDVGGVVCIACAGVVDTPGSSKRHLTAGLTGHRHKIVRRNSRQSTN